MRAQPGALSQAPDTQNLEPHFRRKEGRLSYVDSKQEMSLAVQKCLSFFANDRFKLSAIMRSGFAREVKFNRKKVIFFLFSFCMPLSVWLVKFIAINITVANSNYFRMLTICQILC